MRAAAPRRARRVDASARAPLTRIAPPLAPPHPLRPCHSDPSLRLAAARRLKELLRAKLVESGWRDSLKEHCKELIRSKGKEKVTVDELAAEITPHGRGASGARERGRPRDARAQTCQACVCAGVGRRHVRTIGATAERAHWRRPTTDASSRTQPRAPSPLPGARFRILAATIPQEVKQDLLRRITKFAEEHQD